MNIRSIALFSCTLTSAATADITYLSQIRTVSCAATVPLNGANAWHSAEDFLTFSEKVSCERSGPGHAEAAATHHSELLPDRIIVRGSSSGSWKYGGGSFGGYSVMGGNVVDIWFHVDADSVYSLDVSYTLSDGPPPPSQIHFLFAGSGDFTDVMLDAPSASLVTTGAMPAGDYHLIVDVNRAASGNNDHIATTVNLMLTVTPPLPPCPADFNADGAANSQDLFDFLGAFFAAAPAADFNTDLAIDSQDFFDFLVAFFGGC